MVFGDFSSPDVLKNLKRAELRRQVDELVREYGRDEVLLALIGPNPKPGRPRGSGIDDSAALKNMRRLLSSGGAKTPTEAATESLSLTEVQSRESAIRRLRDKYRKRAEAEKLRTLITDLMDQVLAPLLDKAKENFAVLQRVGTEANENFAVLQRIGTEAARPLAEAVRQMREKNPDLFPPEKNSKD